MRRQRAVLLPVLAWMLGLGAALGAEESEEDSAEGLPPSYAEKFLVAKSTLSPDKKLAVIYPTLDFAESESKEAKDLLVALEPFRVLAPLPTDDPYFQNKSHGAISAEWSEDGRVALITLESKWGPGDVFVVEMADGKVKRITNLLAKLSRLLLPAFRKEVPDQGTNDDYAFIFEPGGEPEEALTLSGSNVVKIDLSATNDPKWVSDNPWRRRVKAQWHIGRAKFTAHKVTADVH